MNSAVFIVALILGALCILAVLYNYVIRSRFEWRDVSILFFGVVLSGMSVWSLIKFKITVDGLEGQFAQTVGEAKADTNAEIEILKKQIGAISQALNVVSKVDPSVHGQVEKIQEAAKPSDELIENANYTVLIFSRDKQLDTANKILSELLRLGYKSSVIKTDLGEARTQFSPGTAWIVWEAGTEKIVDRLKKIIEKTAPAGSIEVRSEAYDLNRGDVQILLF